jgi:hypothetical protein
MLNYLVLLVVPLCITRSGTNNFEGSAYFFNRDESIAGKTPPSLAGVNGKKKLADFCSNLRCSCRWCTITDKLFYFINYERQDNETPQPFDVSTYWAIWK